MARIIANRVILHGNQAVKGLEREIYKRFHSDSKKNTNRDTAIPRILFGLSENSDFNWEEKTGTYWAYFQARDGAEIIFISPFPSISNLQDYITLYAAKVDPNVVVQLEYEDISGAVIGTRLTAYSDSTGVVGFKAHKFTPSADSRELSRTAMGKIRLSQRNQVRKELVKQMGAKYKDLALKN